MEAGYYRAQASPPKIGGIAVLKRISVLIRTKLRKLIEGGDEGFRARGAVMDVLGIKDTLMAWHLCGLEQGARLQHEQLRRYLEVGTAEHQWLKEAFCEASRLQIVIELGPHKNVEFKLKLLKRGERKPIYVMHGSIGLDDGQFVVLSETL